MRFIHLYLAVYFLLIAGAVFALWQAQVLQRMSGEWVGLSVLVSVSLGVLLAVLSSRPSSPSATNRLTSDFASAPARAPIGRVPVMARDMVHATATMRRVYFALILVCVTGLACQEGGTVRVRKLDFKGVQAVSEARLRAALATRVSSRLPWGKKAFFDRSRFDADLKRIEAFYADRGYPDARVRSFDVHLNDKQDSVDLTLTIDEGRPVLVAAVNFNGFDVVGAGSSRVTAEGDRR